MGDTAAANVSANDILPEDASFVAGSTRSGSSCTDAAQAEDDDAAGADESDPYGAAVIDNTLLLQANSLSAGGGFAVTFEMEVN